MFTTKKSLNRRTPPKIFAHIHTEKKAAESDESDVITKKDVESDVTKKSATSDIESDV